jgi:phosphatidylinositol alpha-1,6-mannosyltransferase
VTRTLFVSNDFPPRPGGIQTFVYEMAARQPPGSVVVLTSTWRGANSWDADQPFPVVRIPGSVLLPSPSVRRLAVSLLREHECDSVVFGAAAPLGVLGGSLSEAGAKRIVAITHGHEAGWAQLPGGRSALRRIGERVDVVTYLGDYTRRRIASALTSEAAAKMVRLTPGVDDTVFRPDVDRDLVRTRYGLGDRPVVVSVSRLMPRKGQDTLIRALPAILQRVPDAALLLVGGGPYRSTLEKLVDRLDLRPHVVIAGSVPRAELPQHYAAGDVFAMPCRTRRAGLDVEGLGIVYLEASATGLPVVAGSSGGAPDAVLDGETGHVVDGRRIGQVADQVAGLLEDPARAQKMGAAGRTWVEQAWRWSTQADQLRALVRTEQPYGAGSR